MQLPTNLAGVINATKNIEEPAKKFRNFEMKIMF